MKIFKFKAMALFLSLCFFIYLGNLYYILFADRYDAPMRPNKDSVHTVRGGKDSSVLLTEGCTLYSESGEDLLNLPGQYCRFLPGGFVVTFVDGHLVMLDSDLSVVWKKKVPVHHEISVDPKRREIAVLSNHFSSNSYNIHSVKVYDFQGIEKFHWDTEKEHGWIMAMRDDFAADLRKENDWVHMEGADVKNLSHAPIKINSVFLIQDTALYPKYSFMKPGNILINLQFEKLFLIIDRETGGIVWRFRPEGESHSAKFKKNGRLIYFQNMAKKRNRNILYQIKNYINYYPRAFMSKRGGLRAFYVKEDKSFLISESSILEFDIETDSFAWKYVSPFRFFSRKMGYVVPLENGNILVSHNTHGGSSMEIDRYGKIVWEWFPVERDNKWKLPREVYITNKVSKTLLAPFLENQL